MPRRKHCRTFDTFRRLPMLSRYTTSGTTRCSEFGTRRSTLCRRTRKVIERCLLMTTDPGDLVLDPTCGSGTTAYVAEQWGRRWITIDTSRVALALARQRLMGARFPYYLLADSAEGRAKESELSAAPLPPAEVTDDIRHGFVYERVQHITLKSIANNPDIKEGMSREEIDAAIRRHAEFELLYDKPYEDKKKVRVAGPFTVESLSPHRSLAFAAARRRAGVVNTDASRTPRRRRVVRADDPRQPAHRRDPERAQGGAARVRHASSPTPASYIQAVGEREEAADGDADGGSGSRSARSTGRSARRSSRTPPARPTAPATSTCCACSAFAFDPRWSALATTATSTADEGFANVAAERRARPGAGAAGADERRPGDGRGAEEDRRRQPVHRLRRARHRDRATTATSCG